MSDMIVQPSDVRDYLELNSPGSSSKYSDATIGSNILTAQSDLEQASGRFLCDHPGITWKVTTMLAAQVPLPGFRSFTSITWGGATLTEGSNVWGIPDAMQTGVCVALQFRAWRADNDHPWWLADPLWFDKAMDSPFYPGNMGGGYAYTSMPNDLVIVGDGGPAPGNAPYSFRHAVKVLAAFFTMRPASILADVAITPGGGVLNYTDLPAEVKNFLRVWTIGRQAVSV